MPLSQADALEIVQYLMKVREAEKRRLDLVYAYVKNKICRIYVPRAANQEYKDLVRQSRINVMPLVVTTVAQNLFADGYRPERASENAPAWDIWQGNNMDARQSGVYRAALQYGLSYATVLPGDPVPVIRPYSPRELTAVYDDVINDEWPVYALACTKGFDRKAKKPAHRLRLLDETTVYEFEGKADGSSSAPTFVDAKDHNLGVTPVPRWLNEYGDLDDGSQGEIAPLMTLQDDLQQTTFALKMAQHYAAFRQRWATGMAIATDEQGRPVEPFNAAVNRVWQNESPEGKFGDFQETPLDPYLNARKAILNIICALAQVPPHAMLVSDGMSNLSAEALAAVESGLMRKVGERKTSFGESNEQMLRLAALAAGDKKGWEDTSAQIAWRDTESRSLAQVTDALGKMAQMLDVPKRALWERIPGVTDQDLGRWAKLADEQDSMNKLNQIVNGHPDQQPAADQPEPDAVPAG